MGASQSTANADEKVFHSDTPIQFSQDVMNELSDSIAAAHPSSSSIDEHIRGRIQSEVRRLHDEEEAVKLEIEQALAKENDAWESRSGKDGSQSGEEGGEGSQSHNSTILLGDIEEVRQKVDRYQARHNLLEEKESAKAARALLSCYKQNSSRPLDCWSEVAAFKSLVADTERDYVQTLR